MQNRISSPAFEVARLVTSSNSINPWKNGYTEYLVIIYEDTNTQFIHKPVK